MFVTSRISTATAIDGWQYRFAPALCKASTSDPITPLFSCSCRRSILTSWPLQNSGKTASVQSAAALSSTNHLSLCKLRSLVLLTWPFEQLGLQRLIRSHMNCSLENPSQKKGDLTGIGMKATQFPILMRKSRNLPQESRSAGRMHLHGRGHTLGLMRKSVVWQRV